MNGSELTTEQVPSFFEQLSSYSLLQLRPNVAIPYVVTMSVNLAVGTVGNILILLTLILKEKPWGMGSEFVYNLAVADFCVTGIADPLCILGEYMHMFYMK